VSGGAPAAADQRRGRDQPRTSAAAGDSGLGPTSPAAATPAAVVAAAAAAAAPRPAPPATVHLEQGAGCWSDAAAAPVAPLITAATCQSGNMQCRGEGEAPRASGQPLAHRSQPGRRVDRLRAPAAAIRHASPLRRCCTALLCTVGAADAPLRWELDASTCRGRTVFASTAFASRSGAREGCRARGASLRERCRRPRVISGVVSSTSLGLAEVVRRLVADVQILGAATHTLPARRARLHVRRGHAAGSDMCARLAAQPGGRWSQRRANAAGSVLRCIEGK
jgi:hypothetical protein